MPWGSGGVPDRVPPQGGCTRTPWGCTQTPPGGTWTPGGTWPGTPPGGYPDPPGGKSGTPRGVPSQVPPQGGYPVRYPPRGVPSQVPPGGSGYPPGGGTRSGTPPGGFGYPPGGVPGQDNRRSTHYMAGGMPLAFTQEDFLVQSKKLANQKYSNWRLTF